MFKVHDYVCKYAILPCISLKCRPEDRGISLLRHAYKENGGLQWDLAQFNRGRMYVTRVNPVRMYQYMLTPILMWLLYLILRPSLYHVTLGFGMPSASQLNLTFCATWYTAPSGPSRIFGGSVTTILIQNQKLIKGTNIIFLFRMSNLAMTKILPLINNF